MYNGNRNITTHHRWLTNDYILKDNCRGNGIQTYIDNKKVKDNDNIWSDSNDCPAVSAHWAAEKTYDYFYYNFNRNSFDNNGAEILIYTNDPSGGYDNAYWNGYDLHFGPGNGGNSNNALVSLDVVGHEFTHAVTEYEAGLTYSYESGALNESFSDIFGTMIEFYALGNSGGNYYIGENFWIQGGKLRDLSNPKSKLQPDTYHGTYWQNGSNDNGGVHKNSGVQNYWFYLLSEGGSGVNDNGRAYNVQGIGRDKAARIAYRNLTIYLSSNSNYSDAKNGSIWSAMDLYGSCSNEVIQTIKAWDAVGVSSIGGIGYNLTVDCDLLQTLHNGTILIPARPVTYKAINDISINCNITPNDQPITLVAGSSIKFLEGFKCSSPFSAFIDPCLDGIQLKNDYISEIDFCNTDYRNIQYDPVVSDSSFFNYFSVYPNPTTDIITIEYTISNKTFVNIEIYDMSYSLISSIEHNKLQKEGTYTTTFDMSGLTPGIYCILLRTEYNSIYYKIIKINH